MRYLKAYDTDTEREQQHYKLKLPYMALARDTGNICWNQSGPYDSEVEWLSNNGTAYINTEIVPKITPRIVINVSIQGAVDRDVFGFKSNTQPSFIGDINVFNNCQTFRYYRYYSTAYIGDSLNTSIPAADFVEWDLGNVVKYNGTTLKTITQQSFETNTQSIYLFRGRQIIPNVVRVAKVKIYDGTELKRDFVPVRVGTVGYMWDKVSKQLFGNIGSGSFVLGPDVN